jgi:hypothetical protein
MYQKILVRELLSEGQQLLEALRRNRFVITAAFWHYFSEDLEWRLVIVSPAVDRSGPLAAYGRVRRAVQSINPTHLSLSDVTLIGPNDEAYPALRPTISNSAHFTGTTSAVPFHNFFENYIYQL